VSSSANAALVKANLLKGRDRVAAEKKAALARGRDLVRIACFWGMLGYPGRAQSVIEAQPSATKLLAKDTSNSAPIRLATQG
jgi:hypothetical protein